MKCDFYLSQNPRKELYGEYAIAGLHELGVEVILHDINSRATPKGDFICLWGNKHDANRIAKAAAIPQLILENPYFGNRSTAVSLQWNHPGRAGIRPETPSEVNVVTPQVKPWREGRDGHITIFGQVPTDIMVQGYDLAGWYNAAIPAAANFWQRKVDVRPHPQIQPTNVSLEETLANTWLSITINSTVGVDSALAGVPTVAVDSKSMAWDVAAHSIDGYTRPDRTEWAHWLGWCQFTAAQIASGFALQHYLKAYDEAKADAEEYANVALS